VSHYGGSPPPSSLEGCVCWSPIADCNIKHLNINHSEITEIPDIEPTLLARLSQITHLPTTIPLNSMTFRNHAENQHLKLKSNNLETYNNPFSLDELQDAISKSNDSAVGPDDIHY